jgi:hypothetical protein
MKHPSMILLFALAMFLPLTLMAQDGHHQKHHGDVIGHSEKDFDRDQDGRLNRHRTEQDGAFAQMSINGGSAGVSTITLNVSRGATNDVASTTLNYSDFEIPADFSSITFTNIFGTIPNDVFTGERTNSLVLNLDTSRLDPATSFSQTCTLSLVTFTEVCGPGPLGLIHLEFAENGITRTRILEFDEEQVAGPVTTRTHQRADTGSANFQGSIFGVPVSTSQGTATVGVNHQSTLVITRQ